MRCCSNVKYPAKMIFNFFLQFVLPAEEKEGRGGGGEEEEEKEEKEERRVKTLKADVISFVKTSKGELLYRAEVGDYLVYIMAITNVNVGGD